MFAYLRSHGKRNASHPTSPDGPSQLSDPPNSAPVIRRRFSNRVLNPTKSESQSHQSQDQEDDYGQDVLSQELEPSTISALPPTLPPIPRVASVYEKINGVQYSPSLLKQMSLAQGHKSSRLQTREDVEAIPEEPSVTQPASDILLETATKSPVDPSRQGSEQSDRSSSRPVLSRDPSSGSVSMTGLRTKGQSVVSPHKSRTSAGSLSDFGIPSFPFTLRNQPPPTISGPKPLVQPVGMSPSLFPTDCHRTPPMPSTLPPPPPPPSSKPHSLATQPLTVSTISLVSPPGSLKTSKRSRLRNPMSRLLRRRAAPELEELSDDALVSHRTGSTLPDNFDPSIRGKVVHDFSAPRPKRNYSAATISTLPDSVSSIESGQRERRKGSQESTKPEVAHTPVFRENFDDVDSKETSKANLRAERLANQDFIKRHSQTLDKALPLPPFAKTPPSPDAPSARTSTPPRSSQATRADVSKSDLELFPEFEASSPPRTQTPDPTILTTVIEDVDGGQITLSNASKRRSPPSTTRSRAASNLSLGDSQSGGLSQRMHSRSSRFSFQMGGGDSQAQERLLEERHIKKMAEKPSPPARDSTISDGAALDDEEEAYDYDEMDLEGMEDDVPVVGEDWDYSGIGAGVHNMTLSTMGMSLPDDASTTLARQSAIEQQVSEPSEPAPQGLGIFSPLSNMSLSSVSVPTSAEVIGSDWPTKSPDDDFYFDDGGFADGDHELSADQQAFDESVFDDPTHHLYERKPVASKLALYDSKRTSQELEEEAAARSRNIAPQNSRRAKRSCLPGDFQAPVLEPSETPEIMNDMAAYHQALAKAALQAAEDGRFARKASVDTLAYMESDLNEVGNVLGDGSEIEGDDLENEDVLSSRPSLIPDESRNSKATTSFSPSQLPSDLTDNEAHDQDSDGSKHGALPMKNVLFSLPAVADDGLISPSFTMDMDDYDTCYEDDPMIAAANAEALAYDEEGDYGREFGFYARPNPTATQPSQKLIQIDPNDPNGILTNGGYFGPKDWSEVKRQRSTREPNLTPITERSEFSTRNSFIGLENMGIPQGFPPQQFRTERQRSLGLPGSLPSPGLAQLARMSSPTWDSEMSIGALLRMRNRAFGGSQSSLQSGGGSSPITSSPAQFLSSSMRDSIGSPSGFLQPPRDPRALWSSPVAREVEFMPAGDGFETYDDDDGLLDEVNRISDDEEEEELVDSGGHLPVAALPDFRSPSSQYSVDLRDLKVYTETTVQDEAEADHEEQLDIEEDEEEVDERTQRLTSLEYSSSPPVQPIITTIDNHSTSTPRKPRPTTLQLNLTPQVVDQTKHLRSTSLPSPTSLSALQTSPLLSINEQIASFPIVPSTTPPQIDNSTNPHHHSIPASPISPSNLLSNPVAHTSLDGAAMSPSMTTKMGHRRKGSDSVAYVQERDEVSGEITWILERRRTADDGAVELFRREVVEGGRI